MARKRYTAEQIITKLREAEIELSKGQTTPQVCKKLGISDQTYYRWRKEYGGLRVDQAKRLKQLEQENGCLKRATPPATARIPQNTHGMMSEVTSEPILKSILRVIGSSSLLALIFVVAPHAWLDSIHSALGMGRLPDGPVVGYLARSTSAFYAMVGGLFWVVSFDPGRHRRVLIYLGAAVTVFGAVLLVVDWREGLPLFWKVWEGPFVMAFGLAMLVLSRRLERE